MRSACRRREFWVGLNLVSVGNCMRRVSRWWRSGNLRMSGLVYLAFRFKRCNENDDVFRTVSSGLNLHCFTLAVVMTSLKWSMVYF